MSEPDDPQPGLPVPAPSPRRGEGWGEGERGGAERPSPEGLEPPHPTAPSEQSSQGSVSFSPPGRSEEAPAPYRTRHDGWTAARRGRFFRALAETGCVRDACRVAGISSTSAYRMRSRDPDFAAEWFAALETATPALEAAAYRRAVEGVEEPVVSCGKVVTTKRRYSDSLLRLLIQRGDLAGGLARQAGLLSFAEYRDGWRFDGTGEKVQAPDEDDLLEEIDAKLAAMKARLEGEA